MIKYKELHSFQVSIPFTITDPDDNSRSGKKETGTLIIVKARSAEEIIAFMDNLFAKLMGGK